jgi:CDP-glucose 4,6-dehydratase
VKIPAPVPMDRDFWMRRRVLVTGHTGFKGAWMALLLQSLGADVSGLSRGSTRGPSLYELANVGTEMREFAVDLRDAAAVREAVIEAAPEVVLHLAAQPLVGRSLGDPVLTFEVNLMGTVNVLDAIREVGSEVRAVVVVTSDKCYEHPLDGPRRLVEGDPLGGEDPYSSSKACAELAVSAYRRSFFSVEGSPRVATARAGNVIGGGDWGDGRLVADAVRAVERDETLRVRNPQAMRSWQHVLGPLAGYLLLAQALWTSAGAARAWNFGPPAEDARTVSWMLERMTERWDGALRWELEQEASPSETAYQALDSDVARRELGWRPACDLEEALGLVVEWHRAERGGEDVRAVSLAQIARCV